MPRCSDKDTGDYSTPLSLQQVICTAIGIAVLALVFFRKGSRRVQASTCYGDGCEPTATSPFFLRSQGTATKMRKELMSSSVHTNIPLAPGCKETRVWCSLPLHPMRHGITANLQKQAFEKTFSIKEHRWMGSHKDQVPALLVCCMSRLMLYSGTLHNAWSSYKGIIKLQASLQC